MLNKIVKVIRKLPVEKKRILGIFLALILTILIIILSLAINSIGRDDEKIVPYDQVNPITSIQESVSEIFNKAKPILEQAFSSTTKEKIMEQINPASSSTSTATNVVE